MNLLMKIILFPFLLPIYILKHFNKKNIKSDKIEHPKLPHEKYPEIPFWEEGDELEYFGKYNIREEYEFKNITEDGILTVTKYRDYRQLNIDKFMKIFIVNVSLKIVILKRKLIIQKIVINNFWKIIKQNIIKYLDKIIL